ncbi:MAG: hypothetical protein KAV87_31820 [Desulfobacteraceae bacterium]|nr:hypothetical protein [Desulfobacteraceae bacterium]
MRFKIFILALICLALIACEKGIENPYSPELPNDDKPANVEISGRNIGYVLDDIDPTKAEWSVSGTLVNSGDLPAKNIKVNSKIYDESYNILWSGGYSFINPRTGTSYLDGSEAQDFTATWQGLDSSIFDTWDYNRTLSHGIEITWEDS